MYLFGVYFNIIDGDSGESLIGGKDRMNDVQNQLFPIFGGRSSNFAFKCDRCKNEEAKVNISISN